MPAAESIDKQLELGDPTVAVASTQDEGMNDGQADSILIHVVGTTKFLGAADFRLTLRMRRTQTIGRLRKAVYERASHKFDKTCVLVLIQDPNSLCLSDDETLESLQMHQHDTVYVGWLICVIDVLLLIHAGPHIRHMLVQRHHTFEVLRPFLLKCAHIDPGFSLSFRGTVVGLSDTPKSLNLNNCEHLTVDYPCPSELTETIFGLDSFDQESILSEDGEEQDEVGLPSVVLQNPDPGPETPLGCHRSWGFGETNYQQDVLRDEDKMASRKRKVSQSSDHTRKRRRVSVPESKWRYASQTPPPGELETAPDFPRGQFRNGRRRMAHY
ncbi:hypothetical protein B0H14DRAFT_2856766 [Mycena olivaceomarginata]|nr:hypothetical protein B0H14DRAFT_2856766 [Mycena olivaceomarginata]